MRNLVMQVMGHIRGLSVLVLCGMFGGVFAVNAFANVDEEAARGLAKQNGCFKCHNLTKADQAKKEKDGKPWGEVAEKYSGKADASDKLVLHVTSGNKMKFPDGHEEEHKIIKTKDMVQIKNLVDWILTLKP